MKLFLPIEFCISQKEKALGFGILKILLNFTLVYFLLFFGNKRLCPKMKL